MPKKKPTRVPGAHEGSIGDQTELINVDGMRVAIDHHPLRSYANELPETDEYSFTFNEGVWKRGRRRGPSTDEIYERLYPLGEYLQWDVRRRKNKVYIEYDTRLPFDKQQEHALRGYNLAREVCGLASQAHHPKTIKTFGRDVCIFHLRQIGFTSPQIAWVLLSRRDKAAAGLVLTYEKRIRDALGRQGTAVPQASVLPFARNWNRAVAYLKPILNTGYTPTASRKK